MNTLTGAIAAVVVVLVILFGGLFLYNQSASSITASSTPTGVTSDSSQTNPGQAAGSPTATTLATVSPNSSGAAVTGSVQPNGAFTTYWFEYGTSASLGAVSDKQLLGSGFENLAAPFYLTGLTKDSVYYYRLVAQNQFGDSAGATLTFHTTAQPVTIVGGIPSVQTTQASSITGVSADLNGQITPNKVATTYWFEYGKTKDLGFITSVQSVGDGSVALPASAILQSLEPGTTYYFRLNAQNQFGTVSGTMLNFKTTGQAVVAVPVVTTQLASPFATTTATLRGTVNPVGTQTTYWFEYGTNAALATQVKTTNHKSIGAGQTTASIEQAVTGLAANTAYYYRTVAQNSAGTVKGDIKTIQTN